MPIDAQFDIDVNVPLVPPKPDIRIDRLGQLIIGTWIAELVSLKVLSLPAIYVVDAFIGKSVGGKPQCIIEIVRQPVESGAQICGKFVFAGRPPPFEVYVVATRVLIVEKGNISGDI